MTNTDSPEIIERVLLASHAPAFYKKVRIQIPEDNYRWSGNHAKEKTDCCVEYGLTHP